jgi:hypothetical protein
MSNENERLARVEEQTKRIPILEGKFDAFIVEEQKRRENSAFRRGKFAGAVIALSGLVSVVMGWWAGHR